MNLLPDISGSVLGDDGDISEMPTLVHALDLEKGRLSGYFDELDALKQAVFCILQTERFVYPVHTGEYGSELEGLIGADEDYVKSEAKRRICEALLKDARILFVDGFAFEKKGDALLVSFEVCSEYGSWREEAALR